MLCDDRIVGSNTKFSQFYFVILLPETNVKHYTSKANKKTMAYKLLPPFQIVSHFGFSRFIYIIMHLDIV
jgi:hypothetical protein